MIALAVIVMFIAAAWEADVLLSTGKMVFTTFMGWEARKTSARISSAPTERDHTVDGMSTPDVPQQTISEQG